MQPKLWPLTLGNFAIGTGAMIVPGMLNELSTGLGATPAEIGMLISAFAITVCLSGPFLASWTSAVERRKLLTAALALYAVTHLAAAIAPGYRTLLLVRMVTAIGAAIFTSQAAATAGLMVAPEARGKAIGLVFLGWSISAVFGTPMGAFLGAHIGWRPTMAVIGVIAAVFAAAVWRQIPAKLFVAPMDRAAWKVLLTNTSLLLVVAVTALQAAGMFTIFSYMALALKESINATPTMISLILLCFGITGVTGNVIGARVMDRIGPDRVGMIAMGCMLNAIALWPLTHGSLAFTVILVLFWGFGCFAVNSAQQARLISIAPTLASASVSLNSSAIYLGQATGALIGGAFVSTHGTSKLSFVGALFMAAAIVVSRLALNRSTRSTIAEAA